MILTASTFVLLATECGHVVLSSTSWKLCNNCGRQVSVSGIYLKD